MDNKSLIQNNVDIIRTFNSIKRNDLDIGAYNYFLHFIKKIQKDSKIVFLLNSLDEINVIPWVNYLIENNFNIFGVVRKNFSKWNFVKLNKVGFKINFFKNRYQPVIDSKELINELEYDYIFFPATLFNKNLDFLDDELFMNKRFIINDKKSIKIGYGYSIQCVNANQIESNDVIKLNAIITDKYIID